MFKRVSGTKDILPTEVKRWQKLENTAHKIFANYNYQEIRTPLLEDAALFNRTLGATTEIVQKQMFIIHNQDETYALRPEGTASIVRCYLENNLDKTEGFIKLYYLGPMFRLERPQKGRLRQFHHIGCEAIGSASAKLDIEVIALADQLLKDFGINGYKINLNSLGCANDKQKLSANLKASLEKETENLCNDCQARLKNNVLRVLDCKNDCCQKIVKKLYSEPKHLCPECLAHFTEVKTGLKNLEIPFQVQPQLVRGLDYYNRTVFEITHPGLGSQDAIGAGGRYNHLVTELGGPDQAGIGFAFGTERLLLALGEQPENTKKLIYLITLGDAARDQGLKILKELRAADLACDTDYLGKSIKGAMRTAVDLGADKVLILGDDELKNNLITLKDMQKNTQKQIEIKNIIGELKC